MNNVIVRNKLFEDDLPYWKLARDILHISEATLSRKLRRELPEDEQKRIAALIDDYVSQAGGSERE